MTRKPLKTKDVVQMVNPVVLIGGCVFMVGLKKTVDKLCK